MPLPQCWVLSDGMQTGQQPQAVYVQLRLLPAQGTLLRVRQLSSQGAAVAGLFLPAQHGAPTTARTPTLPAWWPAARSVEKGRGRMPHQTSEATRRPGATEKTRRTRAHPLSFPRNRGTVPGLFALQRSDLLGRHADGAGLNLSAVLVHLKACGHVGGLGRSGVSLRKIEDGNLAG